MLSGYVRFLFPATISSGSIVHIPWRCSLVLLETERLILRNVEDRDVPIIYDYRNNEICSRYQRGQVRTLPEIEELVSLHGCDGINSESPFMLSVAIRETDEMVGEIQVMPSEDCFSLGYTFSYRHHGRGYAYESLSHLLEELHSMYPEFEFISFTEPENVASMHLLEKLGYKHLGYSRKLESEVYGKWLK